MQCSIFSNMTNETDVIQYIFCEVYVEATLSGEVRGHFVASKIFRGFL